MKIFQTAGAEADAELTSALGAGARLYKDGILDTHTITPIRLKSTYEETKRLLFERSVLRPAFKVEDESVILPVLFFKADGGVDELVQSAHAFRQKNNKTILYYTSFHLLNTTKDRTQANDIHDILDEPSLKHLQKAKINLVAKAFKNLTEYVNENYPAISIDALYSLLVLDNDKLFDALHHSNPEKTAPKIIIHTVQRDQLNDAAVLRLKFASELGFDVCILSKDSYASIENILPEDHFDHYVIPVPDEKSSTIHKNQKKSKINWREIIITILGIFLIIRIIAWLF